jgi:hypothetical protein
MRSPQQRQASDIPLGGFAGDDRCIHYATPQRSHKTRPRHLDNPISTFGKRCLKSSSVARKFPADSDM